MRVLTAACRSVVTLSDLQRQIAWALHSGTVVSLLDACREGVGITMPPSGPVGECTRCLCVVALVHAARLEGVPYVPSRICMMHGVQLECVPNLLFRTHVLHPTFALQSPPPSTFS